MSDQYVTHVSHSTYYKDGKRTTGYQASDKYTAVVLDWRDGTRHELGSFDTPAKAFRAAARKVKDLATQRAWPIQSNKG